MNTSKPCLLSVETVADLPVLWASLQRLDLPATLDRHFPTPAHWKGPLTPGEVLAVWLLFLLSQGDHCLNHVEPWVAQHHGTLSALLGKTVLPVALHDDRLADWLDRLSANDAFSVLERELNQQTIRVYQLPTDTVRYDTTTANTYAAVLSEQGLVQFGHSKDDPDRPQLKIAAGVLDPLGMPLVTAVVPGHSTDDPLYVPAIQAVQQSLGQGGRTHVGDCKMPVDRGSKEWPPWPRAPSWRLARISTCARCRRISSAEPSDANCCSRSSPESRRCSRCGVPQGMDNQTSWW